MKGGSSRGTHEAVSSKTGSNGDIGIGIKLLDRLLV